MTNIVDSIIKGELIAFLFFACIALGTYIGKK